MLTVSGIAEGGAAQIVKEQARTARGQRNLVPRPAKIRNGFPLAASKDGILWIVAGIAGREQVTLL